MESAEGRLPCTLTLLCDPVGLCWLLLCQMEGAQVHLSTGSLRKTGLGGFLSLTWGYRSPFLQSLHKTAGNGSQDGGSSH